MIGNVYVRKGDPFIINQFACHFDPKQWIKPELFIPERFDLDNPISQTPTGQKRNPFAYCPFSGGKRSCFGKTLAESTLKIAGTYLTQAFNFEFVDKKLKTNIPMAHDGMSRRNRIEIKLKRKK